MAKRIKLMLEYGCYPMWVYSETGEFLCNDLIDALKGAAEIEVLLEEIQTAYDALFIDDAVEFAYKGFETVEAKAAFLRNVSRLMQLLEETLGDAYAVENKMAEGL